MPLSHIVGLVTGGASGLGSATASTLVRAGARVVVVDLPHQYEQYLHLKGLLSVDVNDRSPVSFVEADVTNEDQVKNALDIVEELYGEPGTSKYAVLRTKKGPR
jgi:NAD(P)-dependent dehydrogenase (short-subunit alcohol dehydrogenase family)